MANKTGQERTSPIIEQYLAFKKEHPDKVIFFRLGDFYEMFRDDAVEVSALLNLTLTERVGNPMCGIPAASFAPYAKRLLEMGKVVAICEQDEETRGQVIMQRKISRILTPGTLSDEDFLCPGVNNIICSISSRPGNIWAGVFVDYSVGDYTYESFDSLAALCDEIEKKNASEIVISDDDYYATPLSRQAFQALSDRVKRVPSSWSNPKIAFDEIQARFHDEAKLIISNREGLEWHAFAQLISYYSSLNILDSTVINSISSTLTSPYMTLSETAVRSLELFSSSRGNRTQASLFNVIDHCITPSGRRRLALWLERPLYSIDAITLRQENVNWLISNKGEMSNVLSSLEGSGDLERLSTQVYSPSVQPRTLLGVARALRAFFNLFDSGFFDRRKELFSPSITSDYITRARELLTIIDEAIETEADTGYIIKPGFSPLLDEKRETGKSAKALLEAYCEELKANLGITKLRLAYSRSFGYSLEVPNSLIKSVPENWRARQTLVNAVRYVTPEFTSLEESLMHSSEECGAIEREVWLKVLDKARSACPVMKAIGECLSCLDATYSLSKCSLSSGWVRPEIVSSGEITIVDARHPVVEALNPKESFVPNSLSLKSLDKTFAFITGPNMAGKSTYLRQNALVIILAQIGAFVPAQSAQITPVDRIFCRIGASDDISKGESTFYVEMIETSSILRFATKNSFVIMDEIGRGTGAAEGQAIAASVAMYLAENGIKTLFATHYPAIWSYLESDSHTFALTSEVEERNNKPVFLRKMKSGVATTSYALHVARLAHLNETVLKRAQKILCENKQTSNNLFEYFGEVDTAVPNGNFEGSVPQDAPNIHPIIEELRRVNINDTTPLDALQILDKLVNMSHEENQ